MLPGAERHLGHDDDFQLACGRRLVERRADAQAPLDIGSRKILLPEGVPILRLDGNITSRDTVPGQQSVDLGLAVGQALLGDVGLEHTPLGLETLERKIGQLGGKNLGQLLGETGNIQSDKIHIM